MALEAEALRGKKACSLHAMPRRCLNEYQSNR
jgi:hypothetical protein